MSLLIADGQKYTSYSTNDESEFEKYVKKHYKDIFGEKSLFFEKKKLTSLAGISSIPDGFIVTFHQSKWYIIEVELANHSPHKHIVPQINSFLAFIKNSNDRRQIVKAFLDFIRNDNVLEATIKDWLGKIEIHEFLSDTVFTEPEIIIIIDEITEKIMEATQIYQPKIVEFKIFQREGVGINVYAVQFEPVVRLKIPSGDNTSASSDNRTSIIRTPQSDFTFPILEALFEMGGSGRMSEVIDRVQIKMKDKLTSKDLEKLPSGTAVRWINRVQWERQRLKMDGYLKKDSPFGIWELTDEGKKLYTKLLVS